MQSLTGSTGLAGNVTQELMEQTSDALTAIATSTATQAEEVANVVVTTTNIQQEIRNVLLQLQSMQARLTAVENFTRWNEGAGGGYTAPGGRGAGRGAGRDGGRGRGQGGRGRGNHHNESYCHTHGRTRRDDHTSATCETREKATLLRQHYTTAKVVAIVIAETNDGWAGETDR